MTIIVTADLHLSAKARDRYRLDNMRRLIKLVRKRQATKLLILGDLTEAKDYHGAWLTNQVVDLMTEASQVCPITVLMGNHDYEADAAVPYFRFLRHIPNIRWIGNPTTVQDLEGIGPAMFLPHTRNHRRDWKNLPIKDYKLVFAHNAFEGAVSEHGHRLSGINTAVFNKKALVLAGDIHTPQSVGPVTYVGAPWTVDFGDSYKPHVVELTRDSVSTIGVSKWPQKVLLRFKTYRDGVKHIEGGCQEGDIAKAVLKLSREEFDRWPTLRNQVREAVLEYGAYPFTIVPEVSKDESKRVRLQVQQHEAKSDRDIVEEFGASREVGKATMKMGVKML